MFKLLLLVGAVIVLVVTLLACIVVYLLFFTTTEKPVVHCTTESCLAHARRLKATINTSVNPCHDFYAFVCDGWQNAFPHLSVQEKVNDDATESNIKEVINDIWGVERPSRLFYKCVSPEMAEIAENLALLKTFMQNISLHWPHREPGGGDDHPLLVMLHMAVRWDINFLFGLDIGYSNATGIVLIVRRGRSGAVWRDRIERPLSQLEYARIVNEHLSTLNVTSVKSKPAELQEIERQFLEANIPTAHSQQSWFTMSTLDSKTPSIGKGLWLKFCTYSFAILGFKLTSNEWVVLEDSKILENVDKLFGAHSKDKLLIGIAWMLLQSHLWAVAGKPELMFRDNIEDKRRRACLEYVNMRLGLLSSVQHVTTRFSTPEVRQGFTDFLLSLKKAFISLVKNAAWIDRQSRETAQRKISTMAINILPGEPFFAPLQRAALYSSFPNVDAHGFFLNWLNSSEIYQKLQSSRHFKDVYSKRRTFRHTAYSYTYLLNEVETPLASLDPPLLYTDAPFAVNYASAGSLLAKEISKSIDPRGVLIDDRGENVIWWGKSHSAEYGRHTGCDLGKMGQTPMDVFPAIPALEASFTAYKMAVAELGALEGSVLTLRLSELERYSEEQVFFITYCFALCSRKGAATRHECNVPVRHNNYFSEAFDCPHGSPMSATKKCSFFS
ncbi:endothelin-converting enzyme 1-like [Amblyomma americanum]